MTEVLLPWLQQAWSMLYARQQAGSLPHALLIEGRRGIGKLSFARFVADALLCTEPGTQGGCGHCNACALLRAGSHPDLRELQPAEDSSVIKIDQIRELISWLQLTRQYQRHKIVILTPADAMNRNAANSFLKTLEEPASGQLILLLSEQRGLLPATVVSRCQRVSLTLENREAALGWLSGQGIEDPELALTLADDGPLLASCDTEGETRQRLFAVWQDIMLGKASIARCVEAVADIPTRSCLLLISSWVADIARLRVDAQARIRHPDLRCGLSALADTLHAEQWFTLYDQLLQLYRTDSASIKTQTVLEGVFAAIRLDQKQNQIC